MEIENCFLLSGLRTFTFSSKQKLPFVLFEVHLRFFFFILSLIKASLVARTFFV